MNSLNQHPSDATASKGDGDGPDFFDRAIDSLDEESNDVLRISGSSVVDGDVRFIPSLPQKFQ